MTSIGIFDSGVGGLTVLRELRHRLPGESFVYLGDTARLPYGAKSARTIKRYLAQNVAFLEEVGVKAIVVACNSASTALAAEQWGGTPIYGVIQPGARAAATATRNRKVGVLGTRATVQSGAYRAAIQAIDPRIETIEQACPLLVPLVEEGWEDDPITRQVLTRYLEPVLARGVDALILGCTHYPVLKGAIRTLAGDGVRLIDSAEAIAERIEADLAAGAIRPDRASGAIRIWTTDLNPAFQRVGRRILTPYDAGEWSLADLHESKGEAPKPENPRGEPRTFT